MIALQRRTIAGVPLLFAATVTFDAPRPLVLWFHGFSADKDANTAELERIASLGVLVAGVDAVGHGERRRPDFDARKAAGDVRRFMLELADATVAELAPLVAALAAEGLIDPQRVAVVGVSMGGYLVYRAVARGLPLRAAVAVLGSPEWPGHADSPHMRLDAMRRVALLSITAERDASVPPEGARRLHAALGDDDRTRYVELAGAPHLVTGAQWAVIMDETLRWIDDHLVRAAGAQDGG
jgi:dienelactone hydrolase